MFFFFVKKVTAIDLIASCHCFVSLMYSECCKVASLESNRRGLATCKRLHSTLSTTATSRQDWFFSFFFFYEDIFLNLHFFQWPEGGNSSGCQKNPPGLSEFCVDCPGGLQDIISFDDVAYLHKISFSFTYFFFILKSSRGKWCRKQIGYDVIGCLSSQFPKPAVWHYRPTAQKNTLSVDNHNNTRALLARPVSKSR